MRVKRGTKARARRKGILKLAKGFRGRSKNTIRQARARVEKALCYMYRDRRTRKRDFRRLWTLRINAACRREGMSYSTFICGLKRANIDLDRKVLADLAMNKPETFSAVLGLAREHLASGSV